MTEKAKRKYRIINLLTLVAAVLLAGVCVGAVLVWRDHLENRAEAAVLAGEIAGINREIMNTPAPPEDLEARLTTARAGLLDAENILPAAIERNDVVDYLIDLADAYRVEAVPLVVEGWVPESPGSPYNILKLNVSVTGRFDSVADFIAELQESEYSSLTITGLTVTGLDPPGSSSAFSNTTLVTADMNIALYTYTAVAQGDITS